MKRQLLLPALFVITFFTACSGGDKKEKPGNSDESQKETVGPAETGPAGKLEGAWEIKRAVGTAAKTNLGTIYTFKGNTLVLGKEGFNNPGTTEISDSTFSFQMKGNGYTFIYNYRFNGDTLVAEMQNSNGQVFYMVKK